MLACLMAACAHAGAERHVDQDYGVVCYTYKRAISCVEIPEEEDEDDMYEETIAR